MIISSTNTSGFFSSINSMQSLPLDAVPITSISFFSEKYSSIIWINSLLSSTKHTDIFSMKIPPLIQVSIIYIRHNLVISFILLKKHLKILVFLNITPVYSFFLLFSMLFYFFRQHLSKNIYVLFLFY